MARLGATAQSISEVVKRYALLEAQFVHICIVSTTSPVSFREAARAERERLARVLSAKLASKRVAAVGRG